MQPLLDSFGIFFSNPSTPLTALTAPGIEPRIACLLSVMTTHWFSRTIGRLEYHSEDWSALKPSPELSNSGEQAHLSRCNAYNPKTFPLKPFVTMRRFLMRSAEWNLQSYVEPSVTRGSGIVQISNHNDDLMRGQAVSWHGGERHCRVTAIASLPAELVDTWLTTMLISVLQFPVRYVLYRSVATMLALVPTEHTSTLR